MIRSYGSSMIHGSLLRDNESMVYFRLGPIALDFVCYREAEKKRNRLVHVDFVEVLSLLHKDKPYVKWFTQLHCRLPFALHRRATEVPHPRV